ncbi:hypothetical protein [Streptomyces sp. NPDC046332]|uniref:hypothetical protein n=1 Tax=unclassified Streptomyces TaxID=2593676 RepID=UPI003406DAD8
MGCCGNKKTNLDYLITYRSGETERVPSAQGIVVVRQKIIKGGGGTYKMVTPQ